MSGGRAQSCAVPKTRCLFFVSVLWKSLFWYNFLGCCIIDHFFLPYRQENSDTRVIFVLCVLYTQQCLQNEASEILKYVKDRDAKKQLFVTVALKYWGFLFEKVSDFCFFFRYKCSIRQKLNE